MKIAVTKASNSISFGGNNRSAGNADILYALRTLNPHINEVTIVTHRTRNTTIPKPLYFQELMGDFSFDNYDAIMVFNYSINFFGGAESLGMLRFYEKLHQSKVPIIYVLTDGQLLFKKLWPSIWKRDWAKNLKEENYTIDPSRVTYFCQGKDKQRILTEIESKPDNIVPEHMYHFPWEKTILADHHRHFKTPEWNFAERKFHLAYGGTTRNSYRKKKIEKYYINQRNLETLLFGNLRGIAKDGFATFEGKVNYQSFIKWMHRAQATVIIGDKLYENNFFTLRMYESILAGNLVFIDNDFDPFYTFYGETAKNMYVTGPLQVEYMLLNWDNQMKVNMVTQLYNEIVGGYNLKNETEKLTALMEKVIK